MTPCPWVPRAVAALSLAMPACLVMLACREAPARSGVHVAESLASPNPLRPDSIRPDSIQSRATDSLLTLGERIYLRGAYDTARAVWSAALAQGRAEGDSAAVARALTWLGLAAWRTGDYRNARRLGEAALDLKRRWALRTDLSKSYNALGLLAWNEGRLADATELLGDAAAAAQAAGDRRGAAAASGNLALVETELGEFAAARRGFDTARVAGHALGDARLEGNALTNLGMLDVRVGAPQAAVAALREARRLYAAIPYPLGEQNALAQLGTAYAALGEPSMAIAAVDSALRLSRKDGLRQEEAGNLEILADLYHDAGDFPRALALYAEAGTINRELGLAVEAGTDLRSEAEIHRDLDAPERARELASAALAAHRGAEARFEELGDRLLLGDLAARARDSTGAKEQLAVARTLAARLGARRARADVALAAARIADRDRDGPAALSVLRGAARDLVDGGYGAEQEAQWLAMRAYARLGRLDSAVAAGRRAVAALERTRARYGSGLLRTSYLADRRATYGDLVEVLRRQGRTEEAMAMADASRGRALLESLAAARAADETPGASASHAGEGERLLLRIDALADQLRATEGAADADSAAEVKVQFLRVRLEEARAAYETMTIDSEGAAPRSAIAGAALPEVASVRRLLRPDEALVEYLVTDDSLIVFVATARRVTSYSVGVGAGRLTTRVRLARALIVRSRGEPAARLVPLDSLYEILIAPAQRAGLLDEVHRLLLVPQGVLTYLPFAALRDPGTGRYLAQDFTLVALPSAAALTELRTERAEGVAPTGAGVFAPDPGGLPATAFEADAARRALGSAQVLIGGNATERAVRRALTASGIVHLAAHAEMNARNPLFSHIALRPEGAAGTAGDGRLEVHEILGLHIRSALVFLSGCETGLGGGAASDFAPGEDYATLARAFLYAGAKNVIATLWRVEDRGAAEIARRFYGYARGRPLADALALVQRDLLTDARYRAPYYWAGYVLSGAGGVSGPQNGIPASVREERPRPLSGGQVDSREEGL